ncbi:MAG TPA: MoaD/ThiS family protein [Verrucomicrobiae bacterium]|nr:MoaD/ThiS family protein [Verrucomicrobiae bacterium]
MNVTVQFFSYFKELAGCDRFTATVPKGATIAEVMGVIYKQFPKLEPMRKSTLIAVGVDYQDRAYVLNEGDEVSLFPPVQGG